MVDLPELHIAAVSKTIGSYPVLEQVPTPSPASLLPGTALVQVDFSGVCHSDVSLAMGKGTHLPIEPCISGHEGTGHVIALGPAVKPGSEVRIGSKVGLKFVRDTCDSCSACLDGDEESCSRPEISGITVEGTFQRYVVAPVSHLIPIPDDMDLADAGPILCAGLTVYKALLKAELKPGEWVVIPGAGGGLGHLAVQYALAMNYRVVAIDTGEDKQAMMRRYGVHRWIDFRQHEDVADAVKEAIGGPARAAVVTAGSIQPYQEALRYLGPRSTLVCVGFPSKTSPALQVSPIDLVLNSSRIVGSSVGTRAEAQTALSFVSMGKVKIEIQRRALSEIAAVYRELENNQVKGRIVLDMTAGEL